ncbi:MAG: sodium:proton antiporter [Planctomycetales bacterium]|nr:sodium:proton antiporter [Planctomycetales bacterium]
MNTSLQIAGILALGVGAQWAAWRLRLPAIVLLLAFGLALGRVLPADQLGMSDNLFFAVVSLSVGIILFEGGLTLNFRELKGVRGVVIRLVSVGLIVTWLGTAAAAKWVAGFSTESALLLGALLTVSGPTVVLPLLRHVQPVRRIGSLAKWEGIVNDPIGAVLAALVFELLLHGQGEPGIAGESAKVLGITLGLGIALGLGGGYLLQFVLRHYLLPDYLQNPLILAYVLLLFALSNQVQAESGLVTVTVLGVFLANQRTVSVRHIIEFKENLSVLLISMLFVTLASRLKLDAEAFRLLGWESLALVAILILLVRPAAVFVSTIGSDLRWRERAFLAWIHPRGIVAAAVASLLALEIKRKLTGVSGAEHLVEDAPRFELTVFLVIIGTVTIYGLSLAPVARWLGVSGENPQGVLIAGASRSARLIAQAVQNEGFSVLLVDTNPRNNSAARMAGLPVSYASIGSEFVQEEIDLGGIGRLLAMTPNDEVNTLACMGFTDRFGRAGVYQLAATERSSDRTERVTAYRSGRTLFDRAITFSQLEERIAGGAKIKKTSISEDFTYEDFLARYGEGALVLFRVDEAGKLVVATNETEMTVKPGQKIIALVGEGVEPPPDAQPGDSSIFVG